MGEVEYILWLILNTKWNIPGVNRLRRHVTAISIVLSHFLYFHLVFLPPLSHFQSSRLPPSILLHTPLSQPLLSPPTSSRLLQPSSVMTWKYSMDVKKKPSNFPEYCGLNVHRVEENGFTALQIELFHTDTGIYLRTLNLKQWDRTVLLASWEIRNKDRDIPSYHSTSEEEVLEQIRGNVCSATADRALSLRRS